MEFRVLAVGDVVGSSGLAFLKKQLRNIKREHKINFCIVNGENVNMTGLSRDQAQELLDAGADVITLGNHTFGNRSICSELDENEYILRPANLAPQLPGRGVGSYDSHVGPIAVINLLGRCGMDFGPDNPFLQIERILKELDTRLIFLDFHAEATSEKLAMAYLLDGRISAIWGTHTHVPTADCRVLQHGTGYQTDLGMTGPIESILGVRPEQSIAKFRGDLTSRYEVATGPCHLQGAIFTIDSRTGLCTHAQSVQITQKGGLLHASISPCS